MDAVSGRHLDTVILFGTSRTSVFIKAIQCGEGDQGSQGRRNAVRGDVSERQYPQW